MNRPIKKVAVLGAGVMGSAIACHFANIGCSVLLLDMAGPKPDTDHPHRNTHTNGQNAKNSLVANALNKAIKSKPTPLFTKSFISRITPGNLEDDMDKIESCDWIVEAVVENLDIKKSLYDKVEKYKRKDTIITSNTSGIPIRLMLEGRSDEFKKNFCGVHFFNPPRYLKLLEIIPTPHTDDKIIKFLMHYGNLYLGKTTVQCKDTPAFIGNRIGVWSLLSTIRAMQKHQLSIDEIDKLTGVVIGRPKSATFRTADLVGLDTLIKVAENLHTDLPHDESRDVFHIPEAIKKLETKGWIGDKSGQGFYKKTKNRDGKTEILTLDLNTLKYQPQTKVKLSGLETAKTTTNLAKRLAMLLSDKDKAGAFYRDTFFALFQYASRRIPEISDTLFSIDAAMRSGFGWSLGPFEIWDALGVKKTIQDMDAKGYKPNPWVSDMLAAGCPSFYTIEESKEMYYDIPSQTYKPIANTNNLIILKNQDHNTIWENAESKITNIGDGVIAFSWHSKSYTLGSEVIAGMNQAIDLAEKEYNALVIGHQGQDFSLGANLGLIFMYAAEQDYEEIDLMVRTFQNTIMRIRYSSVPVIVAPHGRTLGGGCEAVMHADLVQAAAETYIGLVEVGVGLIPAGGGLKEYTKRLSNELEPGDVELNALQNVFMNIGTAKVATSAEEARTMKILRLQDRISINKDRQITDAKQLALTLARTGYTKPLQETRIKVQGRTGKALFEAAINGMKNGGYISSHDVKIAQRIAHVMCGGELTTPQWVSEQYLLDMERENFIALCGEQKTLERIQAVISGGRPIRN